MEFTVTGTYFGREQSARWRNGALLGSDPVVDQIRHFVRAGVTVSIPGVVTDRAALDRERPLVAAATLLDAFEPGAEITGDNPFTGLADAPDGGAN